MPTLRPPFASQNKCIYPLRNPYIMNMQENPTLPRFAQRNCTAGPLDHLAGRKATNEKENKKIGASDPEKGTHSYDDMSETYRYYPK